MEFLTVDLPRKQYRLHYFPRCLVVLIMTLRWDLPAQCLMHFFHALSWQAHRHLPTLPKNSVAVSRVLAHFPNLFFSKLHNQFGLARYMEFLQSQFHVAARWHVTLFDNVDVSCV